MIRFSGLEGQSVQQGHIDARLGQDLLEPGEVVAVFAISEVVGTEANRVQPAAGVKSHSEAQLEERVPAGTGLEVAGTMLGSGRRTPPPANHDGLSNRSSTRPPSGGVNGGYFDAAMKVVSAGVMIGSESRSEVSWPGPR
jgi:hypothetical protein